MAIQQLLKDLSEEVIGQHGLILRMLIALLAEGHLLVVGAPGLAKTTAVKALANRLEGEFHRIQFTPDLLPSDITGTEIYRAETGSFEFQKGPLFHHFILADEINRAPAKVQSALLEAMAEYQVTVGQVTYPMPELFLVMATQNPIEQEGTYSLPEAQLDRFIMEVNIDYPSKEDEQKVLALVRRQRKLKRGKLKPSNLKLDNSKLGLSENTNQLNQQVLFAARDEVFELHFSDALERYVVELIAATRNPAPYDPSLAKWIRYGASPRGSIALEHCARAHAWLKGRDYVSPEDIHAIAENVLRHRIILSYEAVAEGVTVEEIISSLLKLVPVP
ncbi:MAG: AAA family ATPase [Pseudomonadales bacterium]|nr:AAA family ATPase [Pseudomonadales bacterium]